MDEEIGGTHIDLEVVEPDVEMIQVPVSRFKDLLERANRPALSKLTKKEIDTLIVTRLSEVLLRFFNS